MQLEIPRRWAILLALLVSACDRPPIEEVTRDQPLHNAAVNGDANRIRMLLSSGTDVNSRDQSGWTALHWASHWSTRFGVIRDQASCLRILIANGANVNAKTNLGETPLGLGSWSVDCVRILLKSAADANAADAYGRTPLIG